LRKAHPARPELAYRLVGGTHLELLPDCALLFSHPNQQVHRLNLSGAALASRLQRDATWDQLVAELGEAGVDARTAEKWVAALLDRLADASLLEARPPSLGTTIAGATTLRIAGVAFALQFGSIDLFQLISGAYAGLEKEIGVPDHIFYLAEAGEFVLFSQDSGPTRVARRPTAAVRLKAAILEQVLSAHHDAAALHAACVLRNDDAFLLLGAPGTGKTTMSLALLRHGFAFGSDDVTLVTPRGRLQTIPLPAAIKESAWETAEDLGFGLSGVPVHCRPDGQRVRYYPMPETSLDSSLRIRAIIRLRREPGSDTALQPIARDQALVALFEESRTFDGRCSTEMMQAFAQLVWEADCVDLHYTEAAEAAALIAGYAS